MGGAVDIAPDAVVGEGARFEVAPGGRVTIGPGARLGERCVFLCHERIEVGAGAVLGDDVVLVDFAHDFSDPDTPTRHQPLLTAPIVVGAGAVVGHRTVLERGSNIPPGGTVPPGQRPRMGA